MTNSSYIHASSRSDEGDRIVTETFVLPCDEGDSHRPPKDGACQRDPPVRQANADLHRENSRIAKIDTDGWWSDGDWSKSSGTN